MMEEHKEFIWNKILDLMIENPDIFPIVQFIMDYNKVKKLNRDWIKFQLDKFCGIYVSFEKYYNSLFLFWYIGDNNFKNDFKRLVITSVLNNYKENDILNKNEKNERFKKIINSLK